MAKKTKPEVTDEDTPETRQKAGHKKILEEARENFKLDIEADQPNRDMYRSSMKFCYEIGAQWEKTVKDSRGPKRISREFNETRVKVKSIVNHIRANRPAAKINGVEKGDVDTAEALNGIWLNILNTSNADDITDFAAETQVAAGMGAWMVDTEYCKDSVDQQDIYLRPIRNPLCLVPDRNAKEQDKSDARHWHFYTNLSKPAYEAKYGKADKVASFSADDLDIETNPNTDDDSIWVNAYWRKEPYKRTLVRLVTGETVDKATLAPEQQVAMKQDGTPVERTFTDYKIVQYILSATDIIERNEWAGSEFPFIVAYGEYVVIDGKTRWSGLTPSMMDAQRSHNEALSGVFEKIAASSLAEDWATPEQAKGLMGQWEQSRSENIGVRLYNHDPKEPGPPKRSGGPDVPAALMQAAQMSRDSMKSVSGIFDASLGETSNETSGRAIRARTDQALIVTYNYSDNIAKAIGRTCAIVLDLIPKIIDTERSYRILGKDGAEKYITVNRRDPVSGKIIENDLSRGKFDFVVTQGPNVQTQRQEAAETYTQMSQSNPLLQQAAGDIIFENLDIPGGKQVAERLKLLLPPQIQQAINKDNPIDPRVAAAMQQVELMQQQVQEQASLAQEATQQAQTDKAAATNEKAAAAQQRAQIDIAAANLKTQQAQFDTSVANFKTLVAQTEAKFAAMDLADGETKTAEQEQANVTERDALVDQVNQALTALHEQASQNTQAITQVMEQVATPKSSGPKTAVSNRVNGEIHTTVTDEATGETTVAVSRREGGQMVTRIAPTGTVQ